MDNKFKNFRNKYQGKGKRCLIITGGDSSNELVNHYNKLNNIITIGINEFSYIYSTDYCIVSDNLTGFANTEFAQKCTNILMGKYKAAFTYGLENVFWNSPYYYYEIEPIGGNNSIEKIFSFNRLFSVISTTEIGLALALFMGFEIIGIIGWDFYGHAIEQDIKLINQQMLEVFEYTQRNHVSIVNLSINSPLLVFPKITLEEFIYG